MINCTFENGKKAPLRHVVVDAIIVSNRGQTPNRILLIKRAPHLVNGNKWALPGGLLDRDENLEQAVIREVTEETGLSGKVIKLFKIIDDPKRKNEDRQNVAFVYIVEAAGKIKIDPEEVSDAKWFAIDNLPKKEDFAFDHFEIIEDFKPHS